MTARYIVSVFALLVAAGSPLFAQHKPAGKPATDAARAFRLDLDSVPRDEAVTAPASAAPDTAPAAVEPADPHAIPAFSLDTPIVALIADKRARAVLDADLPGLSSDTNLPKFQSLSLRRFQPLTGGQLTDSLLAEVGGHLAALGPATPPAVRGRNQRGR